MEKLIHTDFQELDIAKDISIPLGERIEHPTREEFYTSYPFYKYWKKEHNDKMQEPEGINIYLHIPFCKQICDFCFYMKELVKSSSQVDAYVDALCKEIELVSEIHALRNRKVDAIYIGGGTPSVLNEKQFRKIIDTLHTYHNIDKPEFTFEAEPGTFTKKKLGWYKESGINRISMGVQSFVDEVIAMSHRMHSAEQAIKSIEMVQDMGSFSLNIDLLSGLAGETNKSWDHSLETALNQQVDMLTIYKMKTYANTSFFKKGIRANEITLPTEKEEVDFMKHALNKLDVANYDRWTTFAFTNNAYKHTYVENTWRGNDLVSYGASAYGKIGKISYQNTNNIIAYQKRIANKEVPINRTHLLTTKDLIVKELLLCSTRLYSYSNEEFRAKFGFDYFALIPDTIHQLREKGYITDDTQNLVLTPQGVLYADFLGKVLASSIKEVLGKDEIGFTY